MWKVQLSFLTSFLALDWKKLYELLVEMRRELHRALVEIKVVIKNFYYSLVHHLLVVMYLPDIQ